MREKRNGGKRDEIAVDRMIRERWPTRSRKTVQIINEEPKPGTSRLSDNIMSRV